MCWGEEMFTEAQEPHGQNVASEQGMVMSCKRSLDAMLNLHMHLHVP